MGGIQCPNDIGECCHMVEVLSHTLQIGLSCGKGDEDREVAEHGIQDSMH